jgi:hypothetical protein
MSTYFLSPENGIQCISWRTLSSGIWRNVGFLKTDFSEENVASIFRVEEIYWNEEMC